MRRFQTAFARFMPALLLAGTLSAVRPAHADAAATLEERYHAALSEVTQRVKLAPDPAEKRRILSEFLEHMRGGLRKAGKIQSLGERDREALQAVAGKYDAYLSELEGADGYARVADNRLDDFASYIRQDMEQAPVGGGIYISAGALLVILLILVLLF